MSDFILMQVAQTFANDHLKKFLESYNKQAKDLTDAGRKELIASYFFTAFVDGYNTATGVSNDTRGPLQ